MSTDTKDSRIVWFMMPAGEATMIAKAPRFQPDVVVPCLEDGVAYTAEAKQTAREVLRDATSPDVFPRGEMELFPRINHPSGPYWQDDVRALVRMNVDGLLIPKTESAGDVREVSSWLDEMEHEAGTEPGSTEIVCVVETTKGVWSAHEIASADDRVVALMLGREDYAASLGHMRRHVETISERSPELLFARSHVALACSVAGVGSIDGPTFTFADEEFMNEDASLSARLGFTGKLCAHPAQVRATEFGYTPLAEDLEAAREIIQLEADAKARGVAAVGAVRGMEVTPPIIDQARLLLERQAWADRRAEAR